MKDLRVRDLYENPSVIKPLVKALRIDINNIEHADHYGAKERLKGALAGRADRSPDDIVSLVTSEVCRSFEGMQRPYAETLAYMLIAHVGNIQLGTAEAAATMRG